MKQPDKAPKTLEELGDYINLMEAEADIAWKYMLQKGAQAAAYIRHADDIRHATTLRIQLRQLFQLSRVANALEDSVYGSEELRNGLAAASGGVVGRGLAAMGGPPHEIL